MHDLAMILTLCLGLLFVSTSITKVVNLNDHIQLLQSYKIMSVKYLRPLAVVNLSMELIIGLSLVLFIIPLVGLVFSIFLLFLYSVVIAVNLLRGNKEIDCGCGGILGNKKLSWLLVLRNLILALMCIPLMKFIENSIYISYFDWHYIALLIIALLITLTNNLMNKWAEIRKIMDKISN